MRKANAIMRGFSIGLILAVLFASILVGCLVLYENWRVGPGVGPGWGNTGPAIVVYLWLFGSAVFGLIGGAMGVVIALRKSKKENRE
jgi:hypothetical protein